MDFDKAVNLICKFDLMLAFAEAERGARRPAGTPARKRKAAGAAASARRRPQAAANAAR